MAHIRADLSDGRRTYIQTTYGEPVAEKLNALGAHYDRDRPDGAKGLWWIGSKKRPEVEALLTSAAKAEEAARASGEAAKVVKEDPDKIRLTGKGEYKGRTYYMGASTRDGLRCRLLTLPDAKGAYLDFWANVIEVRILKTYQPREVREGFRGRTRTVYTTLGSIADFIARQKDPATRRGECTECGHHGPWGQPCSECGGEGSYA